jgi:hypothetical protein
MASSFSLPKFPVFDAISRHDPQSTAISHCLSGRSFKYGELLPDVCRVRDQIHRAAGKPDIRGERIAFLIENGYDYVGTELPKQEDPLLQIKSINVLMQYSDIPCDPRFARNCVASFTPISCA